MMLFPKATRQYVWFEVTVLSVRTRRRSRNGLSKCYSTLNYPISSFAMDPNDSCHNGGRNAAIRQCYRQALSKLPNHTIHSSRPMSTTTYLPKCLFGGIRLLSSFTSSSYNPQERKDYNNTTSVAVSPVSSYKSSVSQYETIPASFWLDLQDASMWRKYESDWDHERCRKVVALFDSYLERLVKIDTESMTLDPQDTIRLLDAGTVVIAFKTLLKCKFHSPADMRVTVRLWERRIGQLGRTQLTDHLSLRLLTANAKSGNLGRCLSLLELRHQKQFRPRDREFYFTVTAIQVAAVAAAETQAIGGVTSIAKRQKNIFTSKPPTLDNPTRWLDAILLHMKQRNAIVSTELANHMLQCYVGTGYTGKAVHHFYRVVRHPIEECEADNFLNDRPYDWFFVPKQRTHVFAPAQVKLHFCQQAPPFTKVPYAVKGKSLLRGKESNDNNFGMFRLEVETEADYSVPLSAAFAFADSLQHGACGHAPVHFNTDSYNALIKACVFRGALWRAMHVVDKMLPAANVKPNTTTYNWLLAGLGKVGDVVTAQEYFQKMMTEQNLQPNSFTVQAIVDGMLNVGDAPAAITAVQDSFNQYCILPSYTTHCKILEFCLARGFVYEAKRHVYFLQQLWHWKPHPKYHSRQFINLMKRTQQNEQLQKAALTKLFAYFGERLDETDFL